MWYDISTGCLAQLGERTLHRGDVAGSSPVASTFFMHKKKITSAEVQFKPIQIASPANSASTSQNILTTLVSGMPLIRNAKWIGV